MLVTKCWKSESNFHQCFNGPRFPVGLRVKPRESHASSTRVWHDFAKVISNITNKLASRFGNRAVLHIQHKGLVNLCQEHTESIFLEHILLKVYNSEKFSFGYDFCET